MLNYNMTDSNIGNDEFLKSNHGIYPQSQITLENSSTLEAEVLPIPNNMNKQAVASFQSTDLDDIKQTEENFNSQNSSDFKR
jgi:hypothetical protein